MLTALATAKYPDGSTPPVIEVVRSATFLFAAGQETTTKLLSASMRVLGDHPDVQETLRKDRSRIPVFVEECAAHGRPVKSQFRLARKNTSVGGMDVPAGTTLMVCPGAVNRDPAGSSNPTSSTWTARTCASTSRSAVACTPAPAGRWPASRAGSRSSASWTGWPTSRSTSDKHGPAGERSYNYEPTFILRGLTEINIKFTPVQ